MYRSCYPAAAAHVEPWLTRGHSATLQVLQELQLPEFLNKHDQLHTLFNQYKSQLRQEMRVLLYSEDQK